MNTIGFFNDPHIVYVGFFVYTNTMAKVKVGDKVKLIDSGEIVTIQEVNCSPVSDFVSFWSDELSNGWYYESSSGRTKKNWHNASNRFIEILPNILLYKTIKKHKL